MTERPHKKLIVWQKAMDLVERVYQVTESFPRHEQFGLVAQLRRAAVSVASNIAEGAARQTWKEAVQSFYIARGSLSELDTQLEISFRLEFLSSDQWTTATECAEEVSRILNGLITSRKRGGGALRVLPHPLTSSPPH